jgi:hypothetical protein
MLDTVLLMPNSGSSVVSRPLDRIRFRKSAADQCAACRIERGAYGRAVAGSISAAMKERSSKV